MGILSERLRSARASKRLSQTEVMRLTQINNKTLSGYENAVSEPDYNTLLSLAQLYGVSTDYLLGRVDSPTDSLVLERKITPADIAGENIGEMAAGPVEVTDILKIENDLTYMGAALTRDDIITIRHMIEMALRPRLPKIIPIYPPRPPIDYSIIPRIEDIDPDQIPLPAEFMFRDQRINRNQILMAEGRRPNDEDWKELVKNYKYNPPG